MTKYKVTFEASVWEERIVEAASYTEAWKKAHALSETDEKLAEHSFDPESVYPLRRDPYPYEAKDEDGGTTRYTKPRFDTTFAPRGGYLPDEEDYA